MTFKEAGSERPFFLVHGRLGRVQSFRHYVPYLGADQPFYGIQASGWDGRDESNWYIPDMAARYIREIQRLQPQGPYFLGGFCAGGVVAFEMCQQLRSQGERIGALIMLHTPNPQLSTTRMTLGRIPGKLRMRKERGILAVASFCITWPLRVPIRYAQRILRKSLPVFGIPLPRLLRDRNVGPVIRCARDYLPAKYPGRIVLFRSLEQPEDFELGWGRLAEGGVEVHEIPGARHPLDLLDKPSVTPLVGEKLYAVLDEARGCVASVAGGETNPDSDAATAEG